MTEVAHGQAQGAPESPGYTSAEGDSLSKGIVVDNIVKTYKGGKVKALNGLSLKIAPGEAVGLVGPNGAGKTTLLGCLLGFLAVDKGSVTIDGFAPDDMRSRARVGYLPERLTFDRWMTGRDYMQYHHELSGGRESVRKRECEELLTRVELDPSSWAQPVKKYSRGMLQRLGFAQALVGKPDYLLMDEPTSGMDPQGVIIVRSLLRDLRTKDKLTILLNSHQLDQIERSCDRVAFIAKGQVVGFENLREEAKNIASVMEIKWLSDDVCVDESLIGRTAAANNCLLMHFEEGLARIQTQNLPQSASLIKALVMAGVPVVQAAPDSGRLERVFMEQMSDTK